jgi:hypothetical protein
MKITTARLKEIIKEEIAEAQGIPSPEYHDDASKIGRPVKYDPEKDVYPERYPYYKRPAQWLESLQKIIDEEIEVVLVEGSKTKSARKPAQNKKK